MESGLQVDRVAEQGSGQFDGVLHVVRIDHFAGAVDVTAGDGDAADRDAGADELHGAGVGGAAQQHFALLGQFGFLGGGAHPVDDARVR